MSDTDENKATSTKILLGASNGDHDAYDSSYYAVTIANGQIIRILEFTNDVRRACKDYLQHTSHHGTLNNQVSNGSKSYDIKDYPVPLTSGTTKSGCVAWKTTVDDIMSTVESYITSFKTSNSLQLITASSTWDFLVKCFHATHRIAEQRFSYYKTISSSSVTTVYSIGLLDEYQTLSDYSNSVRSLASDSSVMLTDGSKIVAVNTSNAIHALMNYNASHELVYDKGTRNKKNTFSYPKWTSGIGGGDNESHQRMVRQTIAGLVSKGYQGVGDLHDYSIRGHSYSGLILRMNGGAYGGRYSDSNMKSDSSHHGKNYYVTNLMGEEDWGNQLAYTTSQSANELIANPSPKTSEYPIHQAS